MIHVSKELHFSSSIERDSGCEYQRNETTNVKQNEFIEKPTTNTHNNKKHRTNGEGKTAT